MGLQACTGNGVCARKREPVRCKAESSPRTANTVGKRYKTASDRRPVPVPPLQDVRKFKPRVSARPFRAGRSRVPALEIAESRARAKNA